MQWLQEIKRRRVPQALGLYLGASWGVVQFIDWVVKRYLLSPAVTDAILLIAVGLAPTVLILAWRHGAPGRDPWGRAERVGIPLNLGLVVVLLALAFDGEDLQAATRKVTVRDEDGQVQERQVPQEHQRRQVLLFFWDNETGEREADWLQYGIPEVLALDLAQDPFVEASTPYSGYQKSVFGQLDRAGYRDGLGIPFALQRQIARNLQLQYFVAGRLEGSTAAPELVATLYDSASAAVLAEHRARDGGVLDLVDGLTTWLKHEMGVPRGSERLAPDLRVADRLSESTEAVQAYVEGRRILLLDNDFTAATERWQQAVELDPSFAVAWARLGRTAADQGDMVAASGYLRRAMAHSYKLTERETFVAKALRYFFQSEVEKATAVYEMWSELYPDDTDALASLANIYIWAGHRLEEAAVLYQRLYEVDPRETWVLNSIGDLQATLGRSEEALGWYRKYVEHHPDKELGWLRLGRQQVRAGDLAAARESFEKAALQSEGSVDPALELGDLALRQGQIEDAGKRLQEAADWVTEAQAESRVLRAEIEVATLEGRFEDALERVPRLLAAESTFRTPTNLIGDVEIRYLPLLVEIGREQEALRRLEELGDVLEPPLDVFLAIGGLWVHLEAGDPDSAEPLLGRVEVFFRQWQRDDELYMIDYARGRIAELRGRYREAADHLARAAEGFHRSVQSLRDPLLGLQLGVDHARSLRMAGEPAAASARLDAVLRVFPAFPEAHLEKARLAAATDPVAARSHPDQALVLWAQADRGYDLAAAAARKMRQELSAS